VRSSPTLLAGLIVVVLTTLLPAPLRARQPIPAPAESPDLRPIFNGRDLEGWDGDPRLWSVRDGAIRGETTDAVPCKGNTFLIWKGGTPGDFELRLSFRCSASNNSGIQYRSRHITEGNPPNAWVVRGYQHELRNELRFPNVAGFIYDEGGTRGRLTGVGETVVWHATGKPTVTATGPDQAAFDKLFRLDDWNDVVIHAAGTRIRHFLNGVQVVDFTDADPDRALRDGLLALQLHAGKPMWVEFRAIRFRPLR
jgi:hypothetical protein